MERPKSDDKRDAILTAAASIFAEGGLSAPTSAISKSAGVAEGTLFMYFPTKNDLLNALYRQIKLELAEVLMSGFGRKNDVPGHGTRFSGGVHPRNHGSADASNL
jgi:AcrR family transcriptional regulator